MVSGKSTASATMREPMSIIFHFLECIRNGAKGSRRFSPNSINIKMTLLDELIQVCVLLGSQTADVFPGGSTISQRFLIVCTIIGTALTAGILAATVVLYYVLQRYGLRQLNLTTSSSENRRLTRRYTRNSCLERTRHM